MRICELYNRPEPTISFEFFPPKSAEAEETLFRTTVPALKALNPAFISVTYGAGGSTRDTSVRLVQRLRHDHGVEALSHLTCVGHTRDEIGGILRDIKSKGVENILALRGDPPKGQESFTATAGGFSYATDLIRYVREQGEFCIGAACYPEGHVENANKHADWDHAAEKIEAGASFLITQLFYDWSDFLDMSTYLRDRHGVTAPIIPGILPFLTTDQIKRFTQLCGSKIPGPVRKNLERFAGDDESVRKYGVEVCTSLCEKLLKHGVAGFHFYCLNRAGSSGEVLRNLGLAR